MALATQCPHCHTTFRVAHDQLKLRAGLVRCGACKQIFNGIENLMRLEEKVSAAVPPDTSQQAHDAFAPPEPVKAPESPGLPESSVAPEAPAWAPSKPAQSALSSGVGLDFPREANEESHSRQVAAEDEPDSHQNEPAAPQAEAQESVRQDTEDVAADDALSAEGETPAEEDLSGQDDLSDEEAHVDEANVDSETDDISADHPPEDPLLRMTLLDVSSAVPASSSEHPQAYPDPLDQAMEELEHKPLRGTRASLTEKDEDGDDEPSFVRQGRRRQRFGRALRLATATACALLLLTLLAQSAYVFRDQLAARLPSLQPLLLQACAWLDCQVGLPAQIDAVTLDSSELHTMASNSETLALSVLLRNQSAVAQTWPHLELTLNDAAEKPLIRRVFAPSEYLPSDISARLGFPARSEQPVRLFFELEGVKASGYRVYLFHP